MVLVVSFSSSSRVDSHERLEDNEKAIPLLLFLSAATFPGPVHSGVHRQHCSLISQGSTVTIAELKPSIVDFWLALPFRKWSVNNEDNSFILSLGVVALPCKEAKKRKRRQRHRDKTIFFSTASCTWFMRTSVKKAVGVFAHLLPPTGTMVY